MSSRTEVFSWEEECLQHFSTDECLERQSREPVSGVYSLRRVLWDILTRLFFDNLRVTQVEKS